MTERYTVQFMIRISDDLHDRLIQDAVDQDRSRAYIARQILENHYGVSSKKKTLSAYTDERNRLSAPAKRKVKSTPKQG